MSYTPDPTNPAQPTDNTPASTSAAEFRALKQYVQDLLQGSIRQVGDVFYSVNVPVTYPNALMCDGSTYNIADWPVLAARLGFNTGTTFQVPDERCRVRVGQDVGNTTGRLAGSGLSAALVGNVGGVGTQTLVTSNLPAHNHAPITTTVTIIDPQHTHTTNAASQTFAAGSIISNGSTYVAQGATINSASTGITATATTTATSVGTATGVGVVQPSIIYKPYIVAALPTS